MWGDVADHYLPNIGTDRPPAADDRREPDPPGQGSLF
jgi:hypothetical protein